MILVFSDSAAISDYVSGLLIRQIKRQPDVILGLATGGTMEPVYRRFVELARQQQLDVSQLTSFNLDEYVGLSADHPQSYAAYMQHHLFSLLAFDPEKCHVPDGLAGDLDQYCREYSDKLHQHGGVAVQLLGVGGNGHIGFNEPGTAFDTRCHVVELSERTRIDNSRFFADGELVPESAITMGMQDIMDAQQILLLATGPAKASTLAKYHRHDVTEEVPFTLLKRHPDAKIILDQEAASQLPDDVVQKASMAAKQALSEVGQA